MSQLPLSQKITVAITVNGVQRVADCEYRTTLGDFLRHELGLTGTHYARKNYVSRIHPACLRRYKKTPLFNTPANVSSKKRLLKTSILNFFKTKVKPPSPTKNLPNINTVSPSPKSRARGLKRKTRINKK